MANNPPFTPAPGQAFLGSRVFADPVVTSKQVIAAGGLAVGGNIPVIAILSGSGTVGSITQQNGYDTAGNFILTAGTASLNGGSLVSVTFGQPLDVSPIAVIVDAGANSGTLGLSCGATALAKTGFTIQGAAPASGVAYLMSYVVIKSPVGKV